MRTFALALAATILLSGGVAAADGPPSTTRHSIELRGQKIDYVARAGRFEVAGDDGRPAGDVFFSSYQVPAKGRPRPVTFFLPGGPGSDNSWAHLQVFGPKKLTYAGVETNPETLLTVTDLVFIDPVSTGYSRLRDPENSAGFYTTAGDQSALMQTIQKWRERYGAPDAPIFLVGQSYGTPRSNGLAELLSKAGAPMRGTVIMSGGRIAVNTTLPPDLDAALRAPSQAMAAYAHGKIQGASAETVRRETETWARTTYAPLLARTKTFSPEERKAFAADISAHIGVPAAIVEANAFVLNPRAFNAALAPPATLALLDRRKTTQADADNDATLPERIAAVKAYMVDELGYRTDLAYWGLEEGQPDVNGAWEYTGDWAAIQWAIAGGGPPESVPWISRTLAINPAMKVFVSVGYYDSQNSCEVNEETRRRLPPIEAVAITTHCYVGGHSVQRDPPSHVMLNRDIAAFIESIAAGKP